MDDMQSYDIAMLGVLTVATLLGFFKGMARQIASLATLVAGCFLALRLSPWLADYIHQPPPLNRFIAMLLIYLATGLTIWLLLRKVSQIIDRVQLKDFDRQMGALLGAAKGALLCVVITFFSASLSFASRQTVLQSWSGRHITKLIHQTGLVRPKETQDLLDRHLKQLERQLSSAVTEGQKETQHVLDRYLKQLQPQRAPAAADEQGNSQGGSSFFVRDLSDPH